MKGYLLDTNHVSAYFDKHPKIIKAMDAASPEAIHYVSAITLGEIEASYLITRRDEEVSKSLRLFLRERFLRGSDDCSYVLDIDHHTRFSYAAVLDCVLRRFPKPNRRIRDEHHLVQIGIDMNDVWIAATALKHNLTLLSSDRMEKIRVCTEGTESAVAFDSWI